MVMQRGWNTTRTALSLTIGATAANTYYAAQATAGRAAYQAKQALSQFLPQWMVDIFGVTAAWGLEQFSYALLAVLTTVTNTNAVIQAAINEIRVFITSEITKLRQWTLDWIGQVWEYAQQGFENLTRVFNELRSGFNSFLQWILLKIEDVKRLFTLDIKAWVNSIIAELAGPINSWEKVRSMFADFFSDPEEWLYRRIETMLERFW